MTRPPTSARRADIGRRRPVAHDLQSRGHLVLVAADGSLDLLGRGRILVATGVVGALPQLPDRPAQLVIRHSVIHITQCAPIRAHGQPPRMPDAAGLSW
ncbi:hypothetical protein RHCRD62_10264 [Rhodococcus sp. RD6.2]|nr:hypothetical protein RHCRD62_10264 [Rhodococcus sp. RD6.2]